VRWYNKQAADYTAVLSDAGAVYVDLVDVAGGGAAPTFSDDVGTVGRGIYHCRKDLPTPDAGLTAELQSDLNTLYNEDSDASDVASEYEDGEFALAENDAQDVEGPFKDALNVLTSDVAAIDGSGE
jgi:hypothetical protein